MNVNGFIIFLGDEKCGLELLLQKVEFSFFAKNANLFVKKRFKINVWMQIYAEYCRK
jgi:hypothetical protein